MERYEIIKIIVGHDITNRKKRQNLGTYVVPYVAERTLDL